MAAEDAKRHELLRSARLIRCMAIRLVQTLLVGPALHKMRSSSQIVKKCRFRAARR